MSADTERLGRRIADLERAVDDINDFTEKVRDRLKRLEQPNPEPSGQVICPECGGAEIRSDRCTDVFNDREHVCTSCKHSWRVNIKDEIKPDGIAEKRASAIAKGKADARFREVGLDPVEIDASRAADDRREDARLREIEAKCPGSVIGLPQVYRIVYRTVAGAKPTFIHVRAESPTRALMAFIDETSPLQVSSMKLDDEYDGPLLNERENFWPASTQEKSDEDDIQTVPVVREGT